MLFPRRSKYLTRKHFTQCKDTSAKKVCKTPIQLLQNGFLWTAGLLFMCAHDGQSEKKHWSHLHISSEVPEKIGKTKSEPKTSQRDYHEGIWTPFGHKHFRQSHQDRIARELASMLSSCLYTHWNSTWPQRSLHQRSTHMPSSMLETGQSAGIITKEEKGDRRTFRTLTNRPNAPLYWRLSDSARQGYCSWPWESNQTLQVCQLDLWNEKIQSKLSNQQQTSLHTISRFLLEVEPKQWANGSIDSKRVKTAKVWINSN